jgi:pimeloyl-ACP methyl ester carboxylesterase
MTTTTDELHSDSQSHAVPARRRATKLPRKIARIAGGVLGLVAIVAAAGAAYEVIASAGDAAAYPPLGRMVDVGGYKLHLDCRGKGSPTIVMDAGLEKSSLDWSLVQPELALTTQVCTYDRAGMGWSDTAPEPRTPADLAGDLHVLLQNAGVPGPYVLVGHSLAGKNIRMFAAAHPADVAGMVLVDARSELVDATADMKAFAVALESQAAFYSLARQFGVARLFGGGLIDLPLVPPALATQMVLFQTTPAAIAATTQEGLNRAADDEALASSSLGSIPLIVIAADQSMQNLPNWPAAQTAMASLSTSGQLIVAERSGHAVHLDEPKVVIDSALSVIERVRKTN